MALQGSGERVTPAERLLIEAGADDLALASLAARHAAGTALFETTRAEFDGVPRATRAVFALVVGKGSRVVYPCRVKLALVAERPWSQWLTAGARASVEDAFAAAWQEVGGVGESAQLSLQLPLVEELASDVEVDGPSLWLSAFLAASAWFSGSSPARNVIATGAFDKQTDYLDEKRRRAAKCVEALGGPRNARFLAASSIHAAGPDFVTQRRQALARTFAVTPRAPTAPFEPVQVSFDTAAAPLERWRGRTPRAIAFDRPASAERLGPDTDAVMEELRRCPAGGHIELAVRGPQAFAASLGARLRNDPLLDRGVRFIHTNRGAGVAWDGGSFDALVAPDGPPRQSAVRVHLAFQGIPPLDGEHQRVTVADEAAHPDAVFDAMQALRDAVAASEVEVYLGATVAAAFAAGMVVRQRKATFFQFDPRTQRYEPWLSLDR